MTPVSAPPPKRQVVLVVIGLAVLIFAAFHIFGEKQASTETAKIVDPVNERAVGFATELIIDDATAALAGDDSLLSKEEALSLIKLGQVVGAGTYESDYSANEIAADEKYRDKKFVVVGTVQSINKNFMGEAYLQLRGENPFIGVHALMKQGEDGWAKELKRGDRIPMVCVGGVRVANIATLRDCAPFDEYVAGLKPEIKQAVDEEISGKRPVSSKYAKAIATMYIVDSKIPVDSACHTTPRGEPCRKLINEAISMQDVIARRDNLLKSMKLQ